MWDNCFKRENCFKFCDRIKKYVQNNSGLENIFEFLNKIVKKKSEFIFDVLVIILLHQSLPTFERFEKCEWILKDFEIEKYFSISNFELMIILLIWDDQSYLIFNIFHSEIFKKKRIEVINNRMKNIIRKIWKNT